MAAYVKFYDFTEQLVRGTHDWDLNTFKIALTNTAPDQSWITIGTVTQITQANGYTTGGYPTSIQTISEASGTTTVQGTQVVYTASGGAVGPFRYVILYNSTSNGLIAYWDYGSAITLQDGETFTVKFNNASPGTIFTLA